MMHIRPAFHAINCKFGRLLVTILNITLIILILFIVTEFYGTSVVRNGGYTEWTPFSKCSVTCGGGVRSRTRTCSNPEPSFGGYDCRCLGPSLEIDECNTRGCPINGGFERWSSFGECNATCGGGVQKRVRYCVDPPPKFDGKDCAEQQLGPYEEERVCNEHQCPLDGGYSEWEAWSSCSVSCGKGEMKRLRQCNNPKPIAGGKDCLVLGADEETNPCSKECPVNGGYSEWAPWAECTVTCGGGWHTRTRACDSPTPSGGGKSCLQLGYGNPEDTKPCNTSPCSADGGFGDWSNWSTCSKTCGGGRMERLRKCNNPPPAGSGKTCKEQGLGASIEADECNIEAC